MEFGRKQVSRRVRDSHNLPGTVTPRLSLSEPQQPNQPGFRVADAQPLMRVRMHAILSAYLRVLQPGSTATRRPGPTRARRRIRAGCRGGTLHFKRCCGPQQSMEAQRNLLQNMLKASENWILPPAQPGKPTQPSELPWRFPQFPNPSGPQA